MRENNGRAFSGNFIADARIRPFNPTGTARRGNEICWLGHAALLPKASRPSWAKIVCLSWAGIAPKAC
jgi:hypothetical protein